jgi:hypothetical protein
VCGYRGSTHCLPALIIRSLLVPKTYKRKKRLTPTKFNSGHHAFFRSLLPTVLARTLISSLFSVGFEISFLPFSLCIETCSRLRLRVKERAALIR